MHGGKHRPRKGEFPLEREAPRAVFAIPSRDERLRAAKSSDMRKSGGAKKSKGEQYGSVIGMSVEEAWAKLGQFTKPK